MLKCGHLDRTAARVLGGVMLLLPCLAATAAITGARINTSSSLPMGVYLRTDDPHAQLVEFCPIEPFATESRVRGYRTRGNACPDGAVPVLKPVVAMAGDHVALTAEGIRVNGRLLPNTAPLTHDYAGRALRSWSFGSYRVEPGTVWVASTYNRGSYDSRYMGPIKTAQIRARVKPLWTF